MRQIVKLRDREMRGDVLRTYSHRQISEPDRSQGAQLHFAVSDVFFGCKIAEKRILFESADFYNQLLFFNGIIELSVKILPCVEKNDCTG